MKWRENIIMKALAFMAVVAAFTATAILAWYQLVNFNVPWGGGDNGGTGYTRRYLLIRDCDRVVDLVNLKETDAAGMELSLSARRTLEQLAAELDAGATNLRWQLLDGDGRIIYGNTQEDSSKVELGYWADYYREWMRYSDPAPTEEPAEAPRPSAKNAILVLWVDDALRVDDQYRAAALGLEQWQSDRENYFALTLILGVLGVLLAVYLCCGAGHKKGVEGVYLNWFHRIPGDMLLFVLFLAGAAAVDIGIHLVLGSYMNVPIYAQLLVVGLGTSAAMALALGALITVCARCKAHTLLHNTLIWKLCGWSLRLFLLLCGALCTLFVTTGRAIQAVPLVWKAVVGCMAYTMFTFWTFTSWGGAYGVFTRFLLWLLVTALASLYLCTWAYQWKRIRQATQEIIGGNPDCRIDTRRMLPDLRGHADELNNLGHAISAAVEDQMKSEHFKAELITNVSHDLKTPLTSIINYVDLLKKADIADPRAREYIEVLDRKSQRLKKLTEDLVEASKASTGSLAVSWERLDFRQLADQALAECGDRLEAQGLTVVRTLPEGPVWVDADGRHLWRVLDNLLTNCAKYSLPGTRVYVDLRESGGRAVLSVKNISRDPLDVPAERLMERFVRGDESRSVSGSGLGLSIAQSLTELQHGQFSISIDGDLFKAVVSLPLAGDGPPVLRL